MSQTLSNSDSVLLGRLQDDLLSREMLMKEGMGAAKAIIRKTKQECLSIDSVQIGAKLNELRKGRSNENFGKLVSNTFGKLSETKWFNDPYRLACMWADKYPMQFAAMKREHPKCFSIRMLHTHQKALDKAAEAALEAPEEEDEATPAIEEEPTTEATTEEEDGKVIDEDDVDLPDPDAGAAEETEDEDEEVDTNVPFVPTSLEGQVNSLLSVSLLSAHFTHEEFVDEAILRLQNDLEMAMPFLSSLDNLKKLVDTLVDRVNKEIPKGKVQ